MLKFVPLSFAIKEKSSLKTIFSTVLPILFIITLGFACSSCSRFFEKDNAPQPSSLVSFKQEINPKLKWSNKTWISASDNHLAHTPAVYGNTLFTGNASGYVAAFDKNTGERKWRANTRINITSGPGVNEDIVVLGGRYGEVIALDATNGNFLWKTNTQGEIIANPALSEHRVVVKTTDGNVFGLDAISGEKKWQFQQVEPNLILRGSSTPIIANQNIIVGFANGNLAKLALTNGELKWLQPVATPEGAFAIQRMIDIDANPIVFNYSIYAATYQGRIASLDWLSGKIKWSHYLSSYTGMVADSSTIYITDASSFVWAFDATNGETKWKQVKLQARNITGPALIGNYLVIGDSYGYIHWLDKNDGHFVAREKLNGPILASPLTDGTRTVYVSTTKGHLAAFALPRL